MLIPNSDIKALYTAALSGLTYNGQAVKVYDYVPRDETKPYVYFSDVQASTGDAETKRRRGYNVSVQLNIVTAFSGNAGGFYDSEQIAREISQIIAVKPYPQTAGIQNITCQLESSSNQRIEQQNRILYVTIIRFFHHIAETGSPV